jgi:hypothetical protein
MLNATTLSAGDCVRDWVTFHVGAGAHPTFLVYSPAFGSTSTSIKWALG